MKKTLSIIMAFVIALSSFAVMSFAADEPSIIKDMILLETGENKEHAATFALGERVYGKIEGTQTACYKFYVDAEKEVTFKFDASNKLDVTVERHGSTEKYVFNTEESPEKKLVLANAYYFVTVKNFTDVNVDTDIDELSVAADEGESESAPLVTEYKFSAVCSGLAAEVYGSLNRTSADLFVGDSLQLMFTMHPDSVIRDLNVFWRVFDDPATQMKETDVATVGEDGLVKIKMNNGTFTTDTTIKVQAVMYYGSDVEATATCTIKVTAANIYLNPYHDESEAYRLNLGVGAVRNIVATTNAKDTNLIWASSDEAVATVTAAGKITATGVGQAKLTVTIEGTTIHRSILVVVADNYTSVVGIAFSERTAEVRANESIKLGYSFETSPEDRPAPTNSNVIFTSSNPEIATVDAEGNVTGVAEGTATITITSADGGYTDECTVTVKAGIPNWLMVILAPLRIIYNFILLIIGK